MKRKSSDTITVKKKPGAMFKLGGSKLTGLAGAVPIKTITREHQVTELTIVSDWNFAEMDNLRINGVDFVRKK